MAKPQIKIEMGGKSQPIFPEKEQLAAYLGETAEIPPQAVAANQRTIQEPAEAEPKVVPMVAAVPAVSEYIPPREVAAKKSKTFPLHFDEELIKIVDHAFDLSNFKSKQALAKSMIREGCLRIIREKQGAK